MGGKMNIGIEIDPFALDEEWVGQAAKYLKASKMLALARKEHEQVKIDLEVTKAETARKIRNSPDDYDLAKVTEASLAEVLLEQGDYVDAMHEVAQRRYEMDVLSALVSALDHRKSALSKLVDLHLSSYYSKPTASSHAKEEMNEVESKVTRRKVGKRLRLEGE